MGKRSNWAIPYFIFLVLFVALPLLLVAMYAFQDNYGHCEDIHGHRCDEYLRRVIGSSA